MLKDLFSKMGANTRSTIAVVITPNIGVELIEIDNETSTVIKYTSRPLEYNSSLRQISDYGKLRDALDKMYAELNVAITSNVVVSMPNVYFGTITLPSLLPDDGITSAIISEVEQSYIFKRSEPVVSWSDLAINNASESRYIAYSAIQKEALDAVLNVFDDLGARVIAVETSYNSLLRALAYLHLTSEQMANDITWNLMLVMPNSYAILSMVGKRPIDYFEEPLALKTFQDEEIYNAIKTSAQMTLMGLPANYLVIISETDLVSAEILSKKLPFDGTVSYIETNKFTQKEFMSVSLDVIKNNVSMITLSAIGAATRQFCDYQIKLNFIQQGEEEIEDVTNYPKVTFGNYEVELTPTFVKKFSIVVAAVVLLPLAMILIFLGSVVEPSANSKLSSADSTISELENKLKGFKEANNNLTFDIYEVINSNLQANKTKLVNLRALEYALPQDLWITYFETDENGRIDIKGTTGDTRKVYDFYRNLKQIVNNSNITLRRLELSENALDTMALSAYSMGNRFYQFEISDMQVTQSSSFMQSANGEQAEGEEQNSVAKRRPLFELGQPWLYKDNSDNENAKDEKFEKLPEPEPEPEPMIPPPPPDMAPPPPPTPTKLSASEPVAPSPDKLRRYKPESASIEPEAPSPNKLQRIQFQ